MAELTMGLELGHQQALMHVAIAGIGWWSWY